MSKNYRVAIGAILTECNELGGMPIDLSWFERYELRRGDQVLELDHGVVGGVCLLPPGSRRAADPGVRHRARQLLRASRARPLLA